MTLSAIRTAANHVITTISNNRVAASIGAIIGGIASDYAGIMACNKLALLHGADNGGVKALGSLALVITTTIVGASVGAVVGAATDQWLHNNSTSESSA